VLCGVQATDDDLLPEYRSTVYQIVDGDALGNFTINSTTGQISVTSPLDYEMLPASLNGTYKLTVMAIDRQRPSLHDVTTVTVLVHVGVLP